MAIQLAEAQRPETAGILDADQFTFAGQYHHRKGAFDTFYGFDQCRFKSHLEIFNEQMQKYFSIHCRLKDRPGLLEFLFQRVGIDEITVMRDSV